MSQLSEFRSPQGKADYRAAYDAMLQKWPVPYSEQDVATQFGTTHMVVSGPPTAPPLLLLHATGMSATVWQPNVAELGQHFRTYCLDIVNEPGKSVQSQLLKDSADCATWLMETIRALGIPGPLRMIGSSYGGWLTLNLALHHPTVLDRIVLLAPAASLLPISWPSMLMLKLLPYLPLKPSPRAVWATRLILGGVVISMQSA